MAYKHNIRAAYPSEAHYRLLKLLETQPHLSQRALARELGISLGKINYCISQVVEKGWVKAQNFHGSRNKLAYAYLLTPRGLDEKMRLTASFLKRKMAEYDLLKEEIAQLQREVEKDRPEQRS